MLDRRANRLLPRILFIDLIDIYDRWIYRLCQKAHD